MKRALVGYTGFVGSNIDAGGSFDGRFNSKNIEEAFGTSPDLLIYAGVRAEKYLANNAPEKDYEQIRIAADNIRKIGPKKLVLISTIDVFKMPKIVDENTEIDTEDLHPYGLNRYRLEQMMREDFPDALIIRLPGLFGKNIKKNFIYDYINLIPTMLKTEKYTELSGKEPELKAFYEDQGNGFYKVNVQEADREKLKGIFRNLGFSALNFTDSRSRYQFYNLKNLSSDIEKALSADLRLWHPATEPVSAGEVYTYLTGEEFVNEIQPVPADYDYRTLYADVFGGRGGYIADKETVMKEIKEFTAS